MIPAPGKTSPKLFENPSLHLRRVWVMFLAPRLLYSYIQIRGLIFNASRLLRGIAHSKPREGMKEQGINYKEWEPEKLIERVTLLEKQLRELSEKYFALFWRSRRLGLRML